ncbi:hypothetical protein ACFST9_18815 [Hymenobacter monticola]|uniref:DUF805 domain-containing protein n=1 Tax=Hymenobacter monticola TaxID=1705399 RepID=A0ABY4B2V8_9BACT|nr:hypothetical protein [Hymenobacter monticola]UOE32041.1 hypothetical protein MTP16_12950 [Hymenobacter monticola]
MATDPPEKGQHLYAWPLGFNLALLLLLAGLSWPHLYGNGLALLLLALVNGLLGFGFLLFERRRDSGYAGGFFLSFLLLLLIGFGMCSKEAENHRRGTEIIVPVSNS